MKIPELYFKTDTEWRAWLHENYASAKGVYLIFYKVEHENKSMRWEEAVKVALCFGWIDSTVKSLGDGKRRQYFTPRNEKSVWSALNKKYIEVLISENLMHESGLKKIEIGKQNGSWTALDAVENGSISKDLQIEFDKNARAFQNYQNFARPFIQKKLSLLAKPSKTRRNKKKAHI